MKILCTGSDGFIGKHLMVKLMQTEHEVKGYDLGHTFVKGPFDGIIHLAAISRVSLCEKDPVSSLQTNIVLTASLIEMKPKWFIFASTCEKPTNIYGLSKRFCEDYIRLRMEDHIILRLSNVHGDGMNKEKLLPRLAIGEVAEIDASVLPFEHIHVDEVVSQIANFVKRIEQHGFKSFTLKLANGIARTEKELRDVASAYAK